MVRNDPQKPLLLQIICRFLQMDLQQGASTEKLKVVRDRPVFIVKLKVVS
jgi:hypothetical protein